MRPRWLDPGHATPADLAACRAALRDGSRTFLAASHLLPRRVRDPACALYAFCRAADDQVDLHCDIDGGADVLDRLAERLERAYAGRPGPAPADRALADVVARFAIPRALPDALLEGFAWDAAGRTYEDLSALTAYAVRVAGTVGAMMALLMGERSWEGVARACDLGVAMQFTNIARDVGEDARAGRLYLPRAWLREAGVEPDSWLRRPAPGPALEAVVARLLAEADALYLRAEAGIARLPASCRPGIRAAARLYAAIGDEVGRSRDPIGRRAVVAPARKLRLAAGVLAAGPGERAAAAGLAAPVLPEALHLVEAVAGLPVAEGGPWTIGGRMIWMLDLFERLERPAPPIMAEKA